jgi:hypothetical protein
VTSLKESDVNQLTRSKTVFKERADQPNMVEDVLCLFDADDGQDQEPSQTKNTTNRFTSAFNPSFNHRF